MANIADAEDIFLQARATVETWKAEFSKEWNAPLAGMYLQMMEQMQPGTIDRLKQSMPDKAAEIDQLLGGKSNGHHIR